AALGRLHARRGLVQQRRGEVEVQAIVTLEGRLDLPEELAVGEQAGHFVFVLDRQDLEVMARYRLGESAGLADQGAFRDAEALDALAVAFGVGRVLVVAEELAATGDDFVEVFRELPVAALDLARGELALYPGQVDGGSAAPDEGGTVELDRRAVQFDGLQQGGLTHR